FLSWPLSFLWEKRPRKEKMWPTVIVRNYFLAGRNPFRRQHWLLKKRNLKKIIKKEKCHIHQSNSEDVVFFSSIFLIDTYILNYQISNCYFSPIFCMMRNKNSLFRGR